MATRSPPAALSALKRITETILPELVQDLRFGRSEAAAAKIDAILESVAETPQVAAGALKRMRRALDTAVQAGSAAAQFPSNLLRVEEDTVDLESISLSAPVRREVDQLLREYRYADTLREFHVVPRLRVLLSGPPRNGKTSLAGAIARALDLPLIVARSSGLIDSHLGTSAKNIDTIFNFMAVTPSVVFLDEVDTLASHRGADKDVPEATRTTNQLLQRIERLPPHCLLIAATNRPEHLDAAFHGRMQMHLQIERPDEDGMRQIALRELDPSLTPGVDLRDRINGLLSQQFEHAGALELACQDLRRRAALKAAGAIDEI